MNAVTFTPDRIELSVTREYDKHAHQFYTSCQTREFNLTGTGEDQDEADADLMAQIDDYLNSTGSKWSSYTLDEIFIID